MPDMEMLSPEGTAVLLSSLFGKVIYIDMWATWCGPCVKETPYMAALAERMKKRDDILCKG
ncbi:MAG: TlpA family protein disulfide reductase [Alistipes sp.]|nr:TlpA family protein disulfide reductase [Candidatus Minthomonas equi]